MMFADSIGILTDAEVVHRLSILPDPGLWLAAAACHEDLFAALDPGARIGLITREAPTSMLVWESDGSGGSKVHIIPFSGFSTCGADMVMAADAEAMAQIRDATDVYLFEVLRVGIRSGSVVCYMLRRRCDLEARGFDELLEALGFAFMGACR